MTIPVQAGFENARMFGLGTMPQQVEDLDLIWLYPNKALEYSGMADFRMENSSGGTNEWGGVIFNPGFAGDAVLGLYANRPVYSGQFSYELLEDDKPQSQYSWNAVGNFGTNNMLDAFWAQPIGGADLGMHLNYGEFWNGNQQDEQWGLSLGLGFANWAGFDQANIHLDYSFISALGTVTNVRDNGIWTAQVGVLGQTQLDSPDALRLFGELRQDVCHFGGEDVETTASYLGAELNRKVFDGKGLVVTGLTLDYASSTYTGTKEKIVDWVLFWNGGVESQVADWLTLRSGLDANVVSRQYDSTASPTYGTDIYHNVYYTAGFSINWQNFTLNAAVNIADLESQLSGIQPGRGLFFPGNTLTVDYADLKYKF